MKKDGARRPFEQKNLVICSFQFAARNADELMVIPWALVVIDEAHRLRNVYRPDNRIGKALKGALLAEGAADGNTAPELSTARPAALGQLGRSEEEKKTLQEAIELSPKDFCIYVNACPPWMRLADQAHMIEGLRKAGLPE